MWDSIRWSVLTLTPTYLCTYPSWHKKFTLGTMHILCYHICWLFWPLPQSSYDGGFSIHTHNFSAKSKLRFRGRGVKKGLKMCLRNKWMTLYWQEGSRPLSHVSKTLSSLCLLTMYSNNHYRLIIFRKLILPKNCLNENSTWQYW